MPRARTHEATAASGAVILPFRIVRGPVPTVRGRAFQRCGRGGRCRWTPATTTRRTKLHQEHLCSAWSRYVDAPVCALRYHNVYGPRMPRDTPYAGVASIFRSQLAGRRPQVFEDGGQRRELVHVSDVVRANVTALTSAMAQTRAFNVASGHPTTLLEMAEALAAEDGRGLAPEVTGAFRLGDVRHIVADGRRAQTDLSLTDTISPREGPSAVRPRSSPATSEDDAVTPADAWTWTEGGRRASWAVAGVAVAAVVMGAWGARLNADGARMLLNAPPFFGRRAWLATIPSGSSRRHWWPWRSSGGGRASPNAPVGLAPGRVAPRLVCLGVLADGLPRLGPVVALARQPGERVPAARPRARRRGRGARVRANLRGSCPAIPSTYVDTARFRSSASG